MFESILLYKFAHLAKVPHPEPQVWYTLLSTSEVSFIAGRSRNVLPMRINNVDLHLQEINNTIYKALFPLFPLQASTTFSSAPALLCFVTSPLFSSQVSEHSTSTNVMQIYQPPVWRQNTSTLQHPCAAEHSRITHNTLHWIIIEYNTMPVKLIFLLAGVLIHPAKVSVVSSKWLCPHKRSGLIWT